VDSREGPKTLRTNIGWCDTAQQDVTVHVRELGASYADCPHFSVARTCKLQSANGFVTCTRIDEAEEEEERLSSWDRSGGP
jgi:hypothetical protein